MSKDRLKELEKQAQRVDALRRDSTFNEVFQTRFDKIKQTLLMALREPLPQDELLRLNGAWKLLCEIESWFERPGALYERQREREEITNGPAIGFKPTDYDH